MPPPQKLNGTYSFALQGFMHSQNIETQQSLNDRRVAIEGANKVGAKFGKLKNALKLPTELAQPPSIASFYPAQYPKPPSPPNTVRGTPPLVGPPYSSNVGYYPYAEFGILDFQTDGTLSGLIRVNTAGYSGGEFTAVEGVYAFVTKPNVPTGVRTGLFTFRFRPAALNNHVWEYAFVAVTPSVFDLMTLGRVPRPAIGTGQMHRIV